MNHFLPKWLKFNSISFHLGFTALLLVFALLILPFLRPHSVLARGEVLPFFGERKVLEGAETQEFPGNVSVQGGTVLIYDSGGTGYMAFRHDGTDANIDFGNTTDLNIPKNLSLDGYLDMSTESAPDPAADGQMYFDGSAMKFYDGSAWQTMSGGSSLWTDADGYINPTTATGFQIADTTGDTTIPGDLTVSGNDVAFGYGSTISNATDTDLNITGDTDVYIRGSGTGSYLNIGTPAGGASNIHFFYGSTDDIWMSYGTSGKVHWRAAGVEKMTLDSSGQLGIGTTAPGAPLEIVNSASKVLNIDGGGNDDYDHGFYLNGLAALTADTYNGIWLRINQNSSFTSGIYTPSHFRADGEIRQGGGDAGGYEIQTGGQMYVADYIVAMGGLNIGGTADPGTDNLSIDGNIKKPASSLYIDANGASSDVVIQTGGTDKFKVESDGDLWHNGSTGSLVPSGMIGMFDTACPSGWTEVTAFQNKYVVGHDADGTYCEVPWTYCRTWWCVNLASGYCNCYAANTPYSFAFECRCTSPTCDFTALSCTCTDTICACPWMQCDYTVGCYESLNFIAACESTLGTGALCVTAWHRIITKNRLLRYQGGSGIGSAPVREAVFCKKD